MIITLINNWIIFATVGAIITSFFSDPKSFSESSGHFFSWIFLPLLLIIFILIGLIKKDFKLLKKFYIHFMNIKT